MRAGRYMNQNRKVGKMHQNVLVFYKGDLSLIDFENNVVTVIGLLNPDETIESREQKIVSEIVDGAGDKADVTARINQIKAEIENTDSDWDKEKLQERLAKLAGGVAVIKSVQRLKSSSRKRSTASKMLFLQLVQRSKKVLSPVAVLPSSAHAQQCSKLSSRLLVTKRLVHAACTTH